MTDSWRTMLIEAFGETGDDFSKMQTTLNAEELIQKFDSMRGDAAGKAFTAWGESYVYFPVVYDGQESVGWAPRNPCDIATPHQGCE